MSKVTLITGGSANGKSAFAVNQASKLGTKVLFIATCQLFDDEMRVKIERHKSQRPKTWTTMEIYKNISLAIKENSADFFAIIVDCLTLLTSKMIEDGNTDEEIVSEYRNIVKSAKDSDTPVFMVTNEVGSSVVPANNVARRFRELQGRINSIVAGEADNVYFMVSGISVKIK